MKVRPLVIGLLLAVMMSPVAACARTAPAPTPVPTPTPTPVPSVEVEATEYLGTQLTPISEQRNRNLGGDQVIDRESYRLTVDGLVDKPLSLSYADLLGYPQESRLSLLDCVEGWNFTAKWTGPVLSTILDNAGVKPEARVAIFYTADDAKGYTALRLDYLRDNKIIIALKLNDITLPEERGFPFQLVAEGKFGYKWAKWVTRIEVSDQEDFQGYWEAFGYNNDADANGPAFEPSP